MGYETCGSVARILGFDFRWGGGLPIELLEAEVTAVAASEWGSVDRVLEAVSQAVKCIIFPYWKHSIEAVIYIGDPVLSCQLKDHGFPIFDKSL